ncbi:hypothetical protein MMC16_005161 [Acarospora aff. strigata]|nr:hypothetical protein [Acarospora aff. strigata]
MLHIRSLARETFHGSWYSERSLQLVAQLARGPLLVQLLFCFWIVSWIDGLLAEYVGNGKPHFWSLSNLNGPFDWASGVHQGFYWTLSAAICMVFIVPSVAALTVGDPLVGVLNLLGVLLFLLDGTARNPYVDTPHRYADDRLRIALPTSHHEGMLYLLPSSGVGIDAVWSPKVANEHLEADGEMMVLFQHMRSGRWSLSEPLERMRISLARYQQRVIISSSQIQNLASWIYLDKTTRNLSVRRIQCQRVPDVHLIGRDLMYTLCHAEYLVFMGRTRLPRDLQVKLGKLRFLSRSGASPPGTEEIRTVGFTPGFDGYKEAVEYVYAIFDTEVDPLALSFEGTSPPSYSAALSKEPSNIDEYVAELWDASCRHSESLFTALYFFTTVWFMELGNVNGFHIFPLRCRTQDGDLVSQQIVWRQVWYSGLTAQLIAASPAAFGLFVLGYLQ